LAYRSRPSSGENLTSEIWCKSEASYSFRLLCHKKIGDAPSPISTHGCKYTQKILKNEILSGFSSIWAKMFEKIFSFIIKMLTLQNKRKKSGPRGAELEVFFVFEGVQVPS
ncbi:MAG: hypothetical protein ACI3Z0_01610, partial [Candidatus Cryptobacteroides sp.]